MKIVLCGHKAFQGDSQSNNGHSEHVIRYTQSCDKTNGVYVLNSCECYDPRWVSLVSPASSTLDAPTGI